MADEPLPPGELLNQSIAYHDPNGVWQHGAIQIEMEVTYSPDLAARRGAKGSQESLWLSPARETFRFVRRTGEDVVEYGLDHGTGSVAVNGSTEISEEDRERLRLPRARAWHYNADDGHLAIDEIVRLDVEMPEK